MATTLSGNIGVTLAFDYQKIDDFNNVLDSPSFSYAFALVDGTGAGQAQKFFRDRRTVTTGANDDLDLSGTLTDAFGETLAFTAIKGILIYSVPENSTNLTVGLSSAPFVSWLGGTTPTLGPIIPGGMFFLYRPDAAGYAVTATTADILRITNAAGASATYEIILVGDA